MIFYQLCNLKKIFFSLKIIIKKVKLNYLLSRIKSIYSIVLTIRNEFRREFYRKIMHQKRKYLIMGERNQVS